MFQQFGLIKKRHDISIEQFHYHWREIHGLLGLSVLPTVKKYVQNHCFFNQQLPGFPLATYDGASEVYLDSLEDAVDLGKSKGYLEVVRPDEANWLDSFTGHVIARPHVVLDSPPIQKTDFLIKALLLLRRRPGLRVAEFQDHWLNSHSYDMRIPGLLRYVQCHTAPESYNTEPSFDGIAQLWWKDLKTFEQSWSSPQMQEELINNLRAVIDEQASSGMLVYEVRMLWS